MIKSVRFAACAWVLLLPGCGRQSANPSAAPIPPAAESARPDSEPAEPPSRISSSTPDQESVGDPATSVETPGLKSPAPHGPVVEPPAEAADPAEPSLGSSKSMRAARGLLRAFTKALAEGPEEADPFAE